MIDKKSTSDILDLQNTLKTCSHIKEVYFTASGDHYFNKYDLNGKQYGRLNSDMVVSKIVGERKFFKLQSIPTPESEIVKTMTRDEILAYKIEGSETKNLTGKEKKVLDNALAENAELKAKIAELEGKK